MANQESAYWHMVADFANKMSNGDPNKVVYITSIDDPLHMSPGGRVVEVTPRIAGICIVNRTHRESTKAEIEQFALDQANRGVECIKLMELKSASEQAVQKNNIDAAVRAAVQAALTMMAAQKEVTTEQITQTVKSEITKHNKN